MRESEHVRTAIAKGHESEHVSSSPNLWGQSPDQSNSRHRQKKTQNGAET